MHAKKSLALILIPSLFSLIPRSESFGVEGVEIEPRVFLPSPLTAEVESRVDQWGLTSERRLGGIASGTYSNEVGYEVFLWADPKTGSVNPLLSIHLCEGYDLGSYSIRDAAGSLRLSEEVGTVALWGRTRTKRRPLLSLEGGEQIGKGLGGGVLCQLGSALYTLRGSLYGFEYLLRDGVSTEDWEGDFASLLVDLDIFHSERGVLRAATKFRRESLRAQTHTGESKLAHQTILTPFLHLTPGIVANWDASELSPSIQVRYVMNGRFNLNFFYQPEYWAPSFAETYLDQEYPRLNPDLERQTMGRSLGAELMLRIDGLNSLDISLIRKRVKDFVFWQSGTGDLLEPSNGEVELREMRGEIVSGFGILGNRLSLLRRRARDLEGFPVPYQPDLELREKLELIPAGGWRFAAGGSYWGRRRYEKAVRQELPGYFTSFVEGEREIGRGVSLFLRVDNLGDDQYEVLKGHRHQGRIWSGGAKLLL